MDDASPEHLLSISFNQDAKALSVGHKDGYILYRTADIIENQILPFDGECTSAMDSNVKEIVVVERLFSSSLMFVVSQKEPRMMCVYHYISKNQICAHKFSKSILSIKVNRDRIVICLEDLISIYNLKDMKNQEPFQHLHNIVETPLNRLGLVDLSSAASSGLLVYPGSTETGSIHIFDAINLISVNTFVAHEGTLAAIKFNAEGTMLATASAKGTVIRVYGIPQGTRLFEFRRGVTRCVNIYSLSFSADSAYLCSSSNTETVHVFKLEKMEESEKKSEAVTETGASGWFDMIAKTASAYMPSQVTEMISVERSFATAKLPMSVKKNVCALTVLKRQQYVVVATIDGYLYCYLLDAAGGEMDLVKQHRIGPNAEGARGVNELTINTARPRSNNDTNVPNIDDPDDFPPMSHASG